VNAAEGCEVSEPSAAVNGWRIVHSDTIDAGDGEILSSIRWMLDFWRQEQFRASKAEVEVNKPEKEGLPGNAKI
jgi:hypothetical protein